jgi:hypothetical protein
MEATPSKEEADVAPVDTISRRERLAKIIKYKTKMIKRRSAVPIVKKFGGRSQAASTKLRVNGKFVKRS